MALADIWEKMALADVWAKMSLTVVIALAPSVFLLLVGGPMLWLKPRFRLHRIGGFCFLVQYAVAWYFFLTDYDWYKSSILVVSLQLNGCAQTITAMLTFTFLPKQKADPGYYSDQGAIAYDFVQENLFYQLMTLFGFIYYSEAGYALLSKTPVGQFVEAVWVFLPYVVVRPFFPTTHFRDALKNESRASQSNRRFYDLGTVIIKFFYIAAKHYMGLYINYVRFFDLFTAADCRNLNWMVLANAGTVSISIFLHTLRFKKIINPRLAYSLYVIMAYTPFFGAVQLWRVFLEHWQLLVIATIGLLINFAPKKVWKTYQVLVCAGLIALRAGYLDQYVRAA